MRALIVTNQGQLSNSDLTSIAQKQRCLRKRMPKCEAEEDRWPMSLASQLCAFPSVRHNGAHRYRVSVPRLSNYR